MSDDDFNMSLRRFLKRVGVTSQQKIEEAVRAAGAGRPGGKIKAKVVLTVDGLGLRHEIEGEIDTPGGA
jgi:hypothetical protein